MHSLRLLLILFSSHVALCATTGQEDDARYRNALVGQSFFENARPDFEAFATKHLAPELLEDKLRVDVLERLHELHGTARKAELTDITPEDVASVRYGFESAHGGGFSLVLSIQQEPPHRITDLWLEGGMHLDPRAKVVPLKKRTPVTWESLPVRMSEEEADGFSGVVLLRREGKTVFERAYGLANREEGIPMKVDTVFAIGSTPIDFTKAGILLLRERGDLSLDDSITDFFDDVPEDKQGITIKHLMTGRSGLRNFHGLPGDANHDHTWIDREEAVRRILDHKLLFEPGRGNEHSHSAWGLLAAIIELTSVETYDEFMTENFFIPAGMDDTGFYGEPIEAERLAIGYGPESSGKINAPPYWGKTSWLIMGSGGMVSTAGDMHRWSAALRAGKLLAPDSLEEYWPPRGAVLAGGDAFGFEIMYTEDPETSMLVLTNTNIGPRRREFERLARELVRLVSSH